VFGFGVAGCLYGQIEDLLLLLNCVLFVGIGNHYIEYDNLFKSLFESFNSRYDKLNNQLESIPSEGELTKEQKAVLIDYFNLCGEEYFWFGRGRIPKEVWVSWEAGMKHYLRKPPIRAFYEEEVSGSTSYYGWKIDL